MSPSLVGLFSSLFWQAFSFSFCLKKMILHELPCPHGGNTVFSTRFKLKKANFKSAWEWLPATCCDPLVWGSWAPLYPEMLRLFVRLLVIVITTKGAFSILCSAQLQGANPPPGIEAAPSVST